VVQEVVADLDDGAGEVVLLVHRVGGIHTELRLPRRGVSGIPCGTALIR
jgi:hypothetical protein